MFHLDITHFKKYILLQTVFKLITTMDYTSDRYNCIQYSVLKLKLIFFDSVWSNTLFQIEKIYINIMY